MKMAVRGKFALAIVWTSLYIVSSSCPDGWSTSAVQSDNCFYYIPVDATFDDAKKACHHVGGDLVTAKTYSDTAAITDVIQNTKKTKRDVWLDMKMKDNDEGAWESSDGSNVTPSWYEGYPEGDGDCGVLFYSNAKMKNKLCTLKASIFCRGNTSTAHPITTTCSALPEGEEDAIPGTYLYLSCDQGYELSSVGHKKTFCRKDGTWSRTSAELAKCQVESCEDVEIGEEVLETTNGSNDVGMFRNFTCPSGYSFKQDTVFVTITCNANGTWTTGSGSATTVIEDCIVKNMDVNDGNGSTALIISIWTLAVSAACGIAAGKIF